MHDRNIPRALCQRRNFSASTCSSKMVDIAIRGAKPRPRPCLGRQHVASGSGPASLAALRDAVCRGREPPPAQVVARLQSYRWFIVGTVCVGSAMSWVDSSIPRMWLPGLEWGLGAELSTVSWVAVAYLLALAAFLPMFGRLADIVGRKLLYTAGFLVFTVGSALCGLAENLPVLIGFRVIQGIGASLLSANAFAIVMAAAGPARRGRALGIQSAASRRIQRRTGNRRPSAGGARLALGVLDQRAGRPRRHLPGLVRASAHQGATRGQPLRLERRGPDRAGADGAHCRRQRRICMGRGVPGIC